MHSSSISPKSASIQSVAQHPVLGKQEDLKAGYGDLPADAFTKALRSSAETIAAMTPAQRTESIGYALTQKSGIAVLGSMMGRQGVITHRGASERLFRQSYSSRVAGDAEAALDTPIAEANVFNRNHRFLAEFRAEHGDRRMSEFLDISSRMSGGKVNSASQFKKLSPIKQALLTAQVSDELKKAAEVTDAPMSRASVAVSGAFAGSLFVLPKAVRADPVSPAEPKPEPKAAAATRGSLLGRFFGAVQKAVVGIAAAGLLFFGALGFMGNDDKPQVQPEPPVVTQTVVQNDTLWDIDQASPATQTWQELWTMNPDITNPDLIRPGDSVVTDGPRSNPNYAVQQHDTMSKLAARFGVQLDALIAANPHIADPDVINYAPTPDILSIPLVDVAAAPDAKVHTVVKDDTAWDIAQAAGLTMKELRAANPTMGDMSDIYPGDKINIPAQ